MKDTITVNGATILTNLREHKGATTHTIMGKLNIVGIKPLNVTYDVLTDNVVIPEWYLIGDTDKVAVVSELIKACMKEALA